MSEATNVAARALQSVQSMTQVLEEFREVLGHFDDAMLTTRAADGSLHGRPMTIARAETNGDLWFVTRDDSGKVDEVLADPRVAAVMEGDGRFLSVSGRAEVVRDPRLVEDLWRDHWKAWFPKGQDDPALALLHLKAEEAEYWDNHGMKGLKYLLQSARARLEGEPMDAGDRTQHAKVRL